MKKIKLLTPMLSTLALATAIAPIATSCSCTNASKTIPADALKIVGYTLKGIKDGQDLSGYTTLVVPEGVKYIDEGAFTNAFVTAKSDVRTVVLPAGIREIRKGAFKGCTSIRTLDLSAWTSEEIYYMTIADDACEGMIDIGDVILNPDLTEEAKAKVEALFTAAKLDAKWFAPVATGKVVADTTWTSQKVETGKYATYLFSTETKLGDTTTLYAQVARTNSTKGVDIEATELVAKGNNVYALPVKMDNTTNDGDYADFNVTFVAVKEGKAIWKQTLEGFKIINIKADTPVGEYELAPIGEKHKARQDDTTLAKKYWKLKTSTAKDKYTLDADHRLVIYEDLVYEEKMLYPIDLLNTENLKTGFFDKVTDESDAQFFTYEGKEHLHFMNDNNNKTFYKINDETLVSFVVDKQTKWDDNTLIIKQKEGEGKLIIDWNKDTSYLCDDTSSPLYWFFTLITPTDNPLEADVCIDPAMVLADTKTTETYHNDMSSVRLCRAK